MAGMGRRDHRVPDSGGHQMPGPNYGTVTSFLSFYRVLF